MSDCPLCFDSPILCNCNPDDLAKYYEKQYGLEIAKPFRQKTENLRIKIAGIDCLYSELQAILNIPAVEFNNNNWIMFKAELVPEIKKRAAEYYKIAMTAK